MGEFKLKIWGVRSSIPAPLNADQYRHRLREAVGHARSVWEQNPGESPENIFSSLPEEIQTLVGGETSCLEVRNGDSQLILDMGTGARRLGYDMMGRGHKGDIHVLLTNTRWENIQGWPFFIPGFLPTNSVQFYTIHPDCRERFIRQQHFDHFPVEFENMLSRREFEVIAPGATRDLLGFNVTAYGLDDGYAAYRLEQEGRSLLIVPPLFRPGQDVDALIEKHADAFSGVDFMVLEYHSSDSEEAARAMENAARAAAAWQAGRLLLVNHHPAHSDGGLREILAHARSQLNGNAPDVILAAEGDEFDI